MTIIYVSPKTISRVKFSKLFTGKDLIFNIVLCFLEIIICVFVLNINQKRYLKYHVRLPANIRYLYYSILLYENVSSLAVEY